MKRQKKRYIHRKTVYLTIIINEGKEDELLVFTINIKQTLPSTNFRKGRSSSNPWVQQGLNEVFQVKVHLNFDEPEDRAKQSDRLYELATPQIVREEMNYT